MLEGLEVEEVEHLLEMLKPEEERIKVLKVKMSDEAKGARCRGRQAA